MVKYFGVDLDSKLSWNDYKVRMASKARATLAMVSGIGFGKLSVAGAVNLWSSFVRSQMEYGCEIWGEGNWAEAELIQHNMARRILNCSFRTPVAAMMGDLGWITLAARRDLQRLVFWGKMVKMKNSRLTKRVYLQRKQDFLDTESGSNWCYFTHQLLSRLGLLEYWEDESVIPDLVEWKKLVNSKIWEREQILWQKEILNKPMLRTYRIFKSELKLEPYLSHGGFLSRSVMFSIRSGSCRLRIETGRWKRPREEEKDRLCTVCNNGKVENEIHFVTECKEYHDLRLLLYSEILAISEGTLKFVEEKDMEKIFRIVVGVSWGEKEQYEKILKASLNFVYLAMKKRAKLMNDRLV
jgi:hypothetical protein